MYIVTDVDIKAKLGSVIPDQALFYVKFECVYTELRSRVNAVEYHKTKMWWETLRGVSNKNIDSEKKSI